MDNPSPAPSAKPRRRTPWVVLAIAAGTFALAGWAYYNSDAAQKAREREERLAAASQESDATPAATLRVNGFRVERRSAPDVVEMSGVLEPVRVVAEKSRPRHQVPVVRDLDEGVPLLLVVFAEGFDVDLLGLGHGRSGAASTGSW